MKKRLTFVYAYYDNKGMLIRQLQEWEQYPKEIKDQLSVIVTDDCSSKQPITELIPEFEKSSIDLTVYRITKKVPWNWLACRNIGAHYTKTKWLLMTDMDHMIDKQDAPKLFNVLNVLDPSFVYLFTRVDAPKRTHYKPHDDSYLMTHKRFWKIGGYDEEFSGNYGTSGAYRRRAFDSSKGNERLNIPLTRFPREVLADASTTEFVRKHPDNGPKLAVIREKKKAEGRASEILTLSFPYELVYNKRK